MTNQEKIIALLKARRLITIEKEIDMNEFIYLTNLIDNKINELENKGE